VGLEHGGDAFRTRPGTRSEQRRHALDVCAPAVERRTACAGAGRDRARALARSAFRPHQRDGRTGSSSRRRTDDAITRLRDAIELEPRSRVAHLFAARAYIEKGLFDDAAAEAAAARGLGPSNTQAIALEVHANARRGKHTEAKTALAELLRLSRDRYVSPYHLAIACNGLDDPAEAVAWLERGFDERDPMMVFLNVEPQWKNLRGEPRIVRLLKRVKFL
jgi:tetratricopeptide (TPR) repeat protein